MCLFEIVCDVFRIVGQVGISAVLKRLRKEFLVVFLLGAVIILSLVGLLVLEIMKMVHGVSFAFSPLCTVEAQNNTRSLLVWG